MGAGSLRSCHIMTNYSANEHQPPLGLKPILTFPKGRDKLLWRLISVNHISPLSFSPVGEKLVTIVNDKPLTI